MCDNDNVIKILFINYAMTREHLSLLSEERKMVKAEKRHLTCWEQERIVEIACNNAKVIKIIAKLSHGLSSNPSFSTVC